MTTVLIVVHLMVVLAMIALVLLQRSEGGALGIGGGGGGGFMSARGAGNLLSRATGILAMTFFVTSIGLTILARIESKPADILDRLQTGAGGIAVPIDPDDSTSAPAVPGGSGTGPGILEALQPSAPPAAPSAPAAPTQ